MSWAGGSSAIAEKVRTVLLANAGLQLALLPLGPYACAVGALDGVASFLPNTVLHLVLAMNVVVALQRSRIVL